MFEGMEAKDWLEMDLPEYARRFARAEHDRIKQVRKYTGLPYWTHTEAVAKIVKEHGGNDSMVAAAFLHDILEDTEVTEKKLVTLFSHYVVSLVIELTDIFTPENFPNLNRKERKALEAERLSKISGDAKTIKLADLFDNTADIAKHDPNFAKVYLKEKAAILPGLKGGNPELFSKVEKQLNDLINNLTV